MIAKIKMHDCGIFLYLFECYIDGNMCDSYDISSDYELTFGLTWTPASLLLWCYPESDPVLSGGSRML